MVHWGSHTSQPVAPGIRGSAGRFPLAVPMAGATKCSSLRCLLGFVNSLKRVSAVWKQTHAASSPRYFGSRTRGFHRPEPLKQFPLLSAWEGRLLDSNEKLGSRSAHAHCCPRRSSSLWQALGKLTAGVHGVLEGPSKADLPAFSRGDMANSSYSPHHTHTQNPSLCIFKKFSRTKTSLDTQAHSRGPFLLVLPSSTTFSFLSQRLEFSQKNKKF